MSVSKVHYTVTASPKVYARVVLDWEILMVELAFGYVDIFAD